VKITITTTNQLWLITVTWKQRDAAATRHQCRPKRGPPLKRREEVTLPERLELSRGILMTQINSTMGKKRSRQLTNMQ
jgi:hypothetical protein